MFGAVNTVLLGSRSLEAISGVYVRGCAAFSPSLPGTEERWVFRLSKFIKHTHQQDPAEAIIKMRGQKKDFGRHTLQALA
jgi:hypothetical protein